MKKVFALVLVTVFALVIGCGGSQPSSDTTTVEESATVVPDADAALDAVSPEAIGDADEAAPEEMSEESESTPETEDASMGEDAEPQAEADADMADADMADAE